MFHICRDNKNNKATKNIFIPIFKSPIFGEVCQMEKKEKAYKKFIVKSFFVKNMTRMLVSLLNKAFSNII